MNAEGASFSRRRTTGSSARCPQCLQVTDTKDTICQMVIAFRLQGCACTCMRSLRVLIVEDDALIGLLLTELLVEMGHVVCQTATTEAEAIGAAHRQRPDLIIADGRLRSGDGVSAVTEILRQGPVPHIFVSGDPAGIVARRPNAIVLRKPFRQSAFANAIENAFKAVALA
jgi:CheY-like chemotaxis protein